MDSGRKLFRIVLCLLCIALLTGFGDGTPLGAAAPSTGEGGGEIVFIDPAVPDGGAIMAALAGTAEIVRLTTDRAGIDQIAGYLAGRTGIGTVRIVSHGGAGRLVLNNEIIDSNYITDHGAVVASWGRALADGGDILLYACNLATNPAGIRFVERLALLTGADVAASKNPTGKGGDWSLEYQTGPIGAADLAVVGYSHTLETYTVTEPTDDGTGGTEGSLSWAINQANATTEVDDTIVFNLGSENDTVTISAQMPAITDSLTMNGVNQASGNDVTIQVATPGTSEYRVFEINAADKTVAITGMTLRGGDVSRLPRGANMGGAISLAAGTLTLNRVTVANSIGGNGGAIYVNNPLTLTDSTITGNRATNGGGIYADNLSHVVTVSNSTLSGNSATNMGGGMFVSSGGAVALVNSTVAGNSASEGGGIYRGSSGTLTFTNCTVGGNSASLRGGGIFAYRPTVALTGSIVAYNYLSDGSAYADIYNYDSSATISGNSAISGYDLSGVGTGNVAYTYHTGGKGDSLFADYEEIAADTVYRPLLADNGGSTETVALDGCSIALEAGVRTGTYDDEGSTKYAFYNGTDWVKVEDGSTTVSGVTEITTDQRGVAFIGVPDVGSYEGPATPEMDLKQGTTAIADGGSHSFGSHAPETDTDVVFTIENTGTADLTLSGDPIVTITGDDADQFSVRSQPASPVATSGSTTFTIRFSPTEVAGDKTASIAIASNDSNEDPYNLTLTGTVDVALPVVTTAAASSITATTAESGGEVTSDGGTAVTARGVCWGTAANPTTAGSHTTDGTGTGSFTSAMTGLLADTAYYVRAYATNAEGTAYGDNETFTTSADGTGVPTETQDAGPNGGDGNGDGTPDSKQTNVASLPAAAGEGYLTVEVTGCDQIEQVQTYSDGSVGAEDPGYSYPFGLVGFEIPCSPVTVRIYYHGAESLDGCTYRKYGPTPEDWNAFIWYTMPNATFGTEVIGGVTVPYVEFTLTESALGDDTLGFPIVDQGGIAVRGAAIPTLSEWGMMILFLLTITGGLLVSRRRRA